LRSNVASEVVAMTKRLACPPAPGPLEDYAAQFDPLLARLAQRRGFRAYLEGLLLPRDRNKTLTSLAGAEPIVAAQHKAVQGLQWFLTESSWDHEQVSQRRVQLLREDPATAPHDQGALVLDDSGDRKAGTKTAHVARQYLGSVGKTDNSNRGGLQPVGRRARLLADRGGPLHPGVAACQGQP
jgi:SRSO17 transposase